MSWVRPDPESFPDLPHTPVNPRLYDVGSWSEAWYKVYRARRVLNPGPVVCESITLSARTQLLLHAVGCVFAPQMGHALDNRLRGTTCWH